MERKEKQENDNDQDDHDKQQKPPAKGAITKNTNSTENMELQEEDV